MHVQLLCGLLSITTPASLLANEFHVQSVLHGQVSLAAVNQICVIHKAMNSCKNLKIHKDFFKTVNITLCLGSIGMDCIITETCYKGTILQKNYRKMTIPLSNFMVKIFGSPNMTVRGHVVQSVMCLTADPAVASLNPAWSHTFWRLIMKPFLVHSPPICWFKKGC